MSSTKSKDDRQPKRAVIAYVPVVHEGYRRFFAAHADAAWFVLGDELIALEEYLKKEIRQLAPSGAAAALSALFSKDVAVADAAVLSELTAETHIIMPDEDVSRAVAEKYFSGRAVSFESVFLRWDKHKAMEEKPVEADQRISREAFDRKVIHTLKDEAAKSSDWWRRIAAAIFKDGKMLSSVHNEHVPSPHTPYANGDPRNTLHKGVGVEYSTAIHCEARLVAEAARDGVSLKGASMYVTVFPCPACAKQIAFSGITKLYYAGGYSVLDQERVLKAKGVDIIYVSEE